MQVLNYNPSFFRWYSALQKSACPMYPPNKQSNDINQFGVLYRYIQTQWSVVYCEQKPFLVEYGEWNDELNRPGSTCFRDLHHSRW